MLIRSAEREVKKNIVQGAVAGRSFCSPAPSFTWKTPGSGVEAQNKAKAKRHTPLSYLSINTHGPSVFGLFQSVWSVAPNSGKSLRVTSSLFCGNGEEVSLSSLIVFSRGSDYLLPSSQQQSEFINEADLAEWKIESTEQYAVTENRTYSRVISPTEETLWLTSPF